MKLADYFKAFVVTCNKKVVRLSALALFTAILTTQAFAGDLSTSCNPNTFISQFEICWQPGYYWYSTCNCTTWDETFGYGNCNVIEGCYSL